MRPWYHTGMANLRRGGLIRWAALAALILLPLLIWMSTRESPALQRSLSIRRGMTRAEVEQILGRSSIELQSANEFSLLYGRSAIPMLTSAVAYDWLGVDIGGDLHVDDWPVEIWFDSKDATVTRVQRRVPGRDPAFLDSEE